MQSNLEMFIQQLREFAGLSLNGPAILNEIKLSLSDHSIDITLTASCARNLVTAPTTEDSQKPSPCKPTSPSQSSLDSSQSTFEHFPLIRNELNGLTIHSVASGILSRLLDESGGSLADVMIQRHSGRDTLMILKVPSQIL